MDKLSPRDKALSDVILEIIVQCSIYKRRRDTFDSNLLNYVINQGYVEDKGEYLKLTKKGNMLYEKLQRCVIEESK